MKSGDNKKIVIALDGPGASGKGTLGRRIAKDLGLKYLDTGKLYRVVGYKFLNGKYGIDDLIENSDDARKDAHDISKNIAVEELDNDKLLTENVARAASYVSSIPEVRSSLLDFQRNVANSSVGAVLDGRDIGTVICPDADFKFFITADVEKRAERRYKELQKHDDSIIYADILEDLKNRDRRDTEKAISPLTPADDSVHIDTTSLSMEKVYNKVMSIILSDTSDR